jgi:uncharacterized protein
MLIEFDSHKQVQTLADRGLDFNDALLIFSGSHYTLQDLREEYGEPRFITIGWLSTHMMMLVWTPRGEVRRIISMRKCNERENRLYETHLNQK